ncbi:putative ABC transport system ATP-binding protein [Peptoniphilus koenoeneniae]|uniref:ABC transport system ATP-binding protein n=1 Tax=Peptoniphilus koenoeneniae TaxID=507751 RepID=A0ABU0AUS0_9FIRM|nr:ABC transporter ATP-binding protein [Peptoniphilus koenoeneniae]MDQ0275006.1 putative ABC transport system ATP-binding protein [Peptoniphilus koenoeneniae]
MAFIEVKNLVKKFITGSSTVVANDNISFEINKGELCLIIGPSGAGKSTLLNILGGMDRADQGQVIIDGKDLVKLNEMELTTYRREDMGFVFQNYNLIPNLTALENVELASQIIEKPLDAKEVLKEVGLENRMDNFPAQLSGGEQQRVAIARAVSKNPKILLCDEPTGALDYKTGKQVLKILQNTARKTETTVLIITHNTMIAPIGDRVLEIVDGKVGKLTVNENPKNIDEIEW